jgi:hypothetical protein
VARALYVGSEMELAPQFIAKLIFTFHEYNSPEEKYFVFGDDGHRSVPMQMDGVDGLNTVGLWIENGPKVFRLGDEIEVKCILLTST